MMMTIPEIQEGLKTLSGSLDEAFKRIEIVSKDLAELRRQVGVAPEDQLSKDA